MIKLHSKSRIINGDETLILYREGETAFEAGRQVAAPNTAHEIKCNVQPLSGRDLQLVPEADRFKEQYWIWTNPESAIKTNDRVVRNGINFAVQNVEPWGSYARARIMRVDVGTYAKR